MGTPKGPIPRKFYRAAYHRFEEAEILCRANRYICTTYLAGYSVECMFKALILDSVPEQFHEEMEKEFRGQRGHNLESLKNQYIQPTGRPLPSKVAQSLSFIVSNWETALRYQPGQGRRREAERFLKEVCRIVEWADTRM